MLERLSPTALYEPTRTKSDLTLPMVGAVLVVGLVFVLVFGASHHPSVSVASSLSTGLMIATASAVAGGVIGFLFGIPKSRQVESQTATRRYLGNTNLEEISDWLTKIIVGLALSQVGKIPDRFQALADHLAKGLGGDDIAEVFSLATLIFFLGCGFLYGYHWARTTLTRLLNDVEANEQA